MKLVRLSRNIPGALKKAATQIAIENAVDLSAFHIVENDPFAAFAQAEVTTRLKYDFDLLESPISGEGITTKGEAIFALDDSVSPSQLMGFASYKPRAPAYNFATIVHIAVDQKYRGKGVFRAIMTELLEHYPAAAIDCPIKLVPLYEKFGFEVEDSFGSHILMLTGPLDGKIAHLEFDELSALPAFRSAKQLLSAKMGANFSAGLTAFNQQNTKATQEAEAFVLAKKSNPST